MVVPLEFMILAERLPPVEMLFAVTFTVAFEPIVPSGAFSIAIPASPCVVRSPVRLKLILALPTMVLTLWLSISGIKGAAG